MTKQEIYQCANDECEQAQEQLDSGQITEKEYFQFLVNIQHNLKTDLEEFDRG